MEKKITYEICPYCGEEVELDAELKVQVCPNCGKHIVTCSMCQALDDDEDDCCTKCPLEHLAHKNNEEKEKEETPQITDIINNFSKLSRTEQIKAVIGMIGQELKNVIGSEDDKHTEPKRNGIMNTSNCHDEELVKRLNECWDNKPWDVRGFIMKALYIRDYEECIDKEVFTEKDCDGWESLDWDWEKFAYDYLMHIADNDDLETILKFLRDF